MFRAITCLIMRLYNKLVKIQQVTLTIQELFCSENMPQVYKMEKDSDMWWDWIIIRIQEITAKQLLPDVIWRQILGLVSLLEQWMWKRLMMWKLEIIKLGFKMDRLMSWHHHLLGRIGRKMLSILMVCHNCGNSHGCCMIRQRTFQAMRQNMSLWWRRWCCEVNEYQDFICFLDWVLWVIVWFSRELIEYVMRHEF